MLSQLSVLGMKGHDISDDELAKSHARYMVGGRINVPNERIFRFGTSSATRLSNDWTDMLVQSSLSERELSVASSKVSAQDGTFPCSTIEITALVCHTVHTARLFTELCLQT